MMNREQYRKYVTNRRMGISPYVSKMLAERDTPEGSELRWEYEGSPDCMYESSVIVPTKEGQVDVKLYIVHDYDPSLDHIGTFHSEYRNGAEDWHRFMMLRGRERDRTCRWFLPQITRDEIAQDLVHMSKGDRNVEIEKRIRSQMNEMRRVEEGLDVYVGIKAVAFLGSTEVGEDSLWGFCLNDNGPEDNNWEYINADAMDLAFTVAEGSTTDLCPTCHGSGRRKEE